MSGVAGRGDEERCLYLVKDSNDLVSRCKCKRALISFPGQMDCPWCGCGWLFTCLKCRKAFTFARAEFLDRSLESIAREDIQQSGQEPTEEFVENWLAEMRPVFEGLEEGERYVYFDGYFLPSETGSIEIDGIHSEHRFDEVPQVAAIKDSSVLEEILANPHYWKEREVSEDEPFSPDAPPGDHESIHLFDPSDPEMERARERARETFKYLLRELSWEQRRIVPALDFAAVKLPFPNDNPTESQPPVEHMWVGDVECDGDLIVGTLLNSPQWITEASQGDVVEAELEELSDWMFAVDGQVYGGFTVNLIRSSMSLEERREHDEAWGLDFGDPEDISLVPTSLDEGKSDRAAAEARALADHPMSLNMVDTLRQMLTDSPEMALERDGDGWMMLHHEALAGNRNIVRVLLEFGADPEARTPNGYTARELADRIGWSEVVRLLPEG
ncbi:MAG: DUF2314 domain-containing protein [Thermoanaerobaculia bacterium]|nr:DUF2314 domain-containing protein [Thermoanaerobaculia bacterium]